MTRFNRFAVLVASAALLLSVFPVASASAELIDEIAPTTKSQVQQVDRNEWVIELVATDDAGGSGVAHTYYELDQKPMAEGTSVAVNGPGMHTLTYWSVDNAGNAESARTREFTPLDFQDRCASCHGLGGGLQ